MYNTPTGSDTRSAPWNSTDDYHTTPMPETHEGWANIYRENDGTFSIDETLYTTEEQAGDALLPNNKTATVFIRFNIYE